MFTTPPHLPLSYPTPTIHTPTLTLPYPYPTLPYPTPTLPYPTLPYPTLPYLPTYPPYPTQYPFPCMPRPNQPHPTPTPPYPTPSHPTQPTNPPHPTPPHPHPTLPYPKYRSLTYKCFKTTYPYPTIPIPLPYHTLPFPNHTLPLPNHTLPLPYPTPTISYFINLASLPFKRKFYQDIRQSHRTMKVGKADLHRLTTKSRSCVMTDQPSGLSCPHERLSENLSFKIVLDFDLLPSPGSMDPEVRCHRVLQGTLVQVSNDQWLSRYELIKTCN